MKFLTNLFSDKQKMGVIKEINKRGVEKNFESEPYCISSIEIINKNKIILHPTAEFCRLGSLNDFLKAYEVSVSLSNVKRMFHWKKEGKRYLLDIVEEGSLAEIMNYFKLNQLCSDATVQKVFQYASHLSNVNSVNSTLSVSQKI